MAEFLLPIIDTTLNTCPIILIDISGSTSDKIKDNCTIRDYEFELAKKMLQKYGQAEIICWSDKAFSLGILKHGDLNTEAMDNINKKCNKYSSGTHMMSGFSLVDLNKFKKEDTIHIIILTDGEINDSNSNIGQKLREFSNYNTNIEIIAIEKGSNNYLLSECNVGNTLYRMIQNNGMTRLVNKFLIYNKLDTEFVNFSNPKVPDGYIPFKDLMFLRADTHKFIKYIIDKIVEIKTNNNKAIYLKLAHDISLTLYHLTKDREYHEQVGMVDLFANMFKDTDLSDLSLYSEVRKLMIDEVNNHMTGKSTTFTSLKKNKHTDIENRNISLMTNTSNSIVDPTKFMDNLYKISFPIRLQNKGITLIKTTDTLTQIRIGKTVYNHAGTKINNNTIPILFKPDETQQKQMNALQWLLLNYSRVLNLSPSNEYIYYYFLSDAYTILKLNKNNITDDIRDLYESYVKIILTGKTDQNQENSKSIIDKIILDGFVKLPPQVFESCSNYIGLKVRPLTLFYMLVTEFIVPIINKDINTKYKLVNDLQNFCQSSIKQDLNTDNLNWDSVQMQLTEFALITIKSVSNKINDLLIPHNKLNIIEICNTAGYIIETHKINGTNVECLARQITENNPVCNLCGTPSNVITLQQKDTQPLNLNDTIKQFYFLSTKHINLGLLDGEKKDDKVIMPEIFFSDNNYDSVELKNITIIDPISSSAMRVKDKYEFKTIVNSKYEFLQDLNMKNVSLCGGFCRSILLKQQMKDFDFFFHGLNNNEEFVNRFHKLLTDIIANIRKQDKTMKFGMFFKPQFNVFELVCFDDPSNHIDEDFTLENFDKYSFHTLRKYMRNSEENDKYYFEDNDEKGIKMKYRIQFILCKFNSIDDIFDSFDMFPSKVAYDGTNVYFTEKSLIAYKYMINEICYEGGSDLFKHRVSKYLKYGFSIVFPPNKRNWLAPNYSNQYNHYTQSTNENIGPLCFKVRNMIDNLIYINHNSNIEKMLEKNEELEQAALEKGKSLYISSLFCSFVSFLRYIKINEINYYFLQDTDTNSFNLPINVTGEFESKIGPVKISFIEKYETIYKTRDWYDEFVSSLILNDY